MKLLGLDIGTNSVGSALIDTDKKTIKLGVSVFPAGVEESGDKRGEPKNQARRRQRQQRRSIKRRAKLKRRLRKYLIKKDWIPTDKEKLQKWENLNPWLLRSEAIHEELKADKDLHGPDQSLIYSEQWQRLVRMLDESGAAISPGEFILAADKADLTKFIDRWIIANTFQVLQERTAAGEDIRFFIKKFADRLI